MIILHKAILYTPGLPAPAWPLPPYPICLLCVCVTPVPASPQGLPPHGVSRGIFLRLFITLLTRQGTARISAWVQTRRDLSSFAFVYSLVPALIVMIPSHAKDQRYLVGKLANGFLVSLILQFSSSRLHLLIPQVFLAKHREGAAEEPGQPLRRGV